MIQRSLSVRGGSHYRTGKPCQDSTFMLEEDGVGIVAVADGHGGDRYIRSDTGSRLAAETSSRVLMELLGKADVCSMSQEQADALFRDTVFPKIVNTWREAVDAYDAENPLTLDEEDFLREKGLGIDRVYDMYGTTLSLGALSERFFVGIQIGDSPLTCTKLLDGETNLCTSEEPVPEDAACVGNITTSMCQKDAESRFRYVLRVAGRDEVPQSVMVSSDGLISTFETVGQFHEYCTNVACMAASDMWDLVVKNAEARSRINKEDDVSVAVMVADPERTIRVREFEPEPEEEPEMNRNLRFKEDETEVGETGGGDSYLLTFGNLVYFRIRRLDPERLEDLQETVTAGIISRSYERMFPERTAIVITDTAPDRDLVSRVKDAMPGGDVVRYMFCVIGNSLSCDYLVRNMPEAGIRRYCCHSCLRDRLLDDLL